MPNVSVTFELKDGRELKCEYPYHVTPGNYSGLSENCYPDEVNVGDPTYYIDDEEVDYDKLPKGLSTIADAMYENGENDNRFKYTAAEPDYGDDYYDDVRDYDEPY